MSQFVTLEQAKAVALRINEIGIGGGVLPYSEDNAKSGIFVPPWAGPFPDPNSGDKKAYYFRFANGCSTINAGLVINSMQSFPMSWSGMLAQEAVPQTPMPWDV